jgi:hypothetical protein
MSIIISSHLRLFYFYKLDFIIQNEVFVIIIPLVKGSLQLEKTTKVGDWFLFEQFTMIRVYGLEEKPYQK